MKKIPKKVLEMQISKKIQELYLRELHHQVGSIVLHFFNQALIILIEESITLPEKKLNTQEHQKLANHIRSVFDRVIQPQIQAIVETTTDMDAIDVLCDTTLDTGRTGIIIILELKSKELISVSS